jgi:hypothetical protein
MLSMTIPLAPLVAVIPAVTPLGIALVTLRLYTQPPPAVHPPEEAIALFVTLRKIQS